MANGVHGRYLRVDLNTGRAEALPIDPAVSRAYLGGVGLGAWLSRERGPLSARRSIAAAGLCGAVAGVVIALAGGRLLGGSLDLVARQFPGSRLQFDRIGGLFGESSFGPISRTVTGALEGLLFAACVVAAMILARRSFNDKAPGQG